MSFGPYAKAIVAFLSSAAGWLAMNVSVIETETGPVLQMPVSGEIAAAIAAALTVTGVVYGVPNKSA